jgi:outer membrane protein assembly factor BamA
LKLATIVSGRNSTFGFHTRRKQLLLFSVAVFFSLQAVAQTPAQDTLIVIGNVSIIGNKITKEHIITRELTFKKGDTLTSSDFEAQRKHSEENLMNTSLFNSVHIGKIVNPDSSVEVMILLTERWYLFPLPVFDIVERNFNVWWQTKDFSRVVYGANVTRYNFRGRNETIGAAIQLGYTQRISFAYTIPYINKGQRSGLRFGFSYSRNHQTPVETFYNKLDYYKDETGYPRRQTLGAVEYTYRKGLYVTHYASTSYLRSEIADSVALFNPDFFGNRKTSQQLISLRYLYKCEHRDFVTYPLRGYEYDIELVKNGLSFINNDVDFAFVTATVRKYWGLGGRWFFSSGFRGKVSDNNFQPYYNTGALGYGRDYVRGYEYYVIDGQKFALIKTNLKFALIRKHEIHAGFIPLEKFATIPYAFYLNLYGDAAYAEDKQFQKYNPLTNSWLYGGGMGIDFVTYYDLVFRFEYSVNRLGESGFFIHFASPI